MKPIKLKQEAADMVIGYNNSAAPLGERKDLDKLLRMAYESNRQDYLDLFEERPDYAELVDESYQNSAEIALPGIQAVLPALPELPAEVAPVVVAEQVVLPEVPASVVEAQSATAEVLPEPPVVPVMTGEQIAEARAEEATGESTASPAPETPEVAKPKKK